MLNRSFGLVVVIATFLLTACSNHSTDGPASVIDMKTLYPLKPGDAWFYRTVRYFNGTPMDTIHDTISVLAQTSFNGMPAYSVKVSYYDTVSKYYDSTGTELWGMKNTSVTGPEHNELVMKYPLSAGDSVTLIDSTRSVDGFRFRTVEYALGTGTMPDMFGHPRLYYRLLFKSYYTIAGELERQPSTEDEYLEPWVGMIYQTYSSSDSRTIDYTRMLENYIVL